MMPKADVVLNLYILEIVQLDKATSGKSGKSLAKNSSEPFIDMKDI